MWIKNMEQKYPFTQFAICINNADYPVSLELHKVYRVLPDEAAAQDGDLRVVDESGEDYLYGADLFILLALPQDAERALTTSFSYIRG
jgi:hypothetical protein